MNQATTKHDFTRRHLLGGTSAAAAATIFSRHAKARAPARGGSGRDVYVQVFLRGALDGLSAVVPYGDGDYYVARPNLAIPVPGATNGAIDLDGFFGLAPAAAPLMTPYLNGHLAFAHACGSTDPTRSHFDAYARMEFGGPNLLPGTLTDGWLTRYLLQMSAPDAGVLRGVSAGHLLPLSLAGAPRSQPIPAFGNYVFPGNPATAQDRLYKLQGMYAGEPPPLGPSAINTLETIDLMDTIPFGAYTPAGGAQYPDTIFGNRMRNIAALIKADVGIEVIHIDFGSWDHHVQQGPLDGDLAAKIDELARSLEAFYLDLLAMIGEVTLVCLSEFGRKVEENSSLGTDHGHGNVMMMMGGGIQGGQVFADWPGLAPAQLNFGDLAVTMDYRDLLGEILTQRLGATDLGAIFPEHTFTTHGVTV